MYGLGIFSFIVCSLAVIFNIATMIIAKETNKRFGGFISLVFNSTVGYYIFMTLGMW